MEYEPLVVGRPSRFAAHLTTMSDFKAVTAGLLVLTLTLPGGETQVVRADGPANPGTLRFNLSPNSAGACTMSLAYEGQGITDTIAAGQCTIYADQAAARADQPKEGEGGVAYTKELQWKTDFANYEVTERSLQPSV